MSSGVYWTRQHERYLLVNADIKPLNEIADDLGRTIGSVKAKLEVLRALSNPAAVAAVKLHWGILSPKDIAAKIKIDRSAVYRIARATSLGKSGFWTGAAEGTEAAIEAMSARPAPPSGYSAAELAWAHARNGDHPEAGMMLLMHRDWREWRKDRLRNKHAARAAA